MRIKFVATTVVTAVLGLMPVALAVDAHARSKGQGGARHAASASFSGGAKVLASSAGARSTFAASGGVAFRPAARPVVAFAGVHPGRPIGFVGPGVNHHVRHRNRHVGGSYGFYGDSHAYGYGSFVSGRTYHSACGWLKARYEHTGLHKWRAQYYECMNAYDY